MKTVSRYRALGSLCRQQAAYNPSQSWKLLAQAEHWEYLAQLEMSSHFLECSTTSSADEAEPGVSINANDARWKTIAAA